MQLSLKMELQFIVFILSISVVVCFPGKSSEDEEDFYKLLGQQLRQNMEEEREYLDGKVAELSDTLQSTLGGKLDHLTEIVEGIARRQKFAAFCTDGICGDNGKCALSDDEEGYVCHCDEGFAGEHCEITGPCNVDLYQVQQMEPMPGREFPRCDEDGSYAAMQFMGSYAVCVTRENEEIDGYNVNRWMMHDDLNCQCARDKYSSVNETKTFNCLSNGNYPPYDCDDRVCWCQDLQGQQYGSPIELGDLDTLLKC